MLQSQDSSITPMSQSGIVPQSEVQQRLARLQAELQGAGLDGALILQQMDLLYFSGTAQNAVLVVPAQGRAVLFARRNLVRAEAEAGVDIVTPLQSWRTLPPALADIGLGPGAALGLALDTLPAALYLRLQQLLQPGQITDISRMVRGVRSRKSTWELDQLRATVPLARAIYDTARATIRPGVTELELSGAVEAAARRLGHAGLVQTRGFNQRLYWGCALAGANAVAPSYFEGVTGGHGLSPASPQGGTHYRIAPGEPILVDLCAMTNGYIIDHTRVFSIGPLPPDLTRAQAVAEDVYAMLLEALRPGVTGEELFDLAVQAATEAGLGEFFMGHGPNQMPFVGHGVGLELDELPVLARGFREPLEIGTVLAIEPKFVIPGRGIVGLENTVAITDNGVEVFGYDPSGLTVL